MPKFIEFKNSSERQELFFYGDIVSDSWSKWQDEDTCPQDVMDVLNQIDENKPLDIYINSGGGSVFAGIAIFNMLKRSKCFKTVHVDGIAGSIASVIAMCGDKIIMPTNAYLMIHKPWNWTAGNSNDMRKMADDLDRIEEGIINTYSEKLADGCDIEQIRQMVNEETWIVGSEASKYFKVEVFESNKAAASLSDLNCYIKVPEELKLPAVQNQDDSELENLKAKLELELL